MSSQRILIVYGTHHGQTAKIAQRMAEVLMAAGNTVTVVNVADIPRGASLRDVDRVIIGGAVQYGRHQRRLHRFVRAHRNALSAVPSAFFSVSGSAGGRTDAERAPAYQYLGEFLRQTAWTPALTATIGGAMAYTKYNPLLRWITKQAAAKAGGPTDTTRDHEATDWGQVERFAEAFAAMPISRDAREPLLVS